MTRYFKPKSLTWWCAFIPATSGALQLVSVDIPYISEYARPIINALYNDIPPSALFNLGLAGIGLRGAIKD